MIVSRSRVDANLSRAVKSEGSWVLTPVASSSRSDWIPFLSPDHKHVAILSGRSGRNQVSVTDPGAVHFHRIRTDKAADMSGLGWEPDGKTRIITIPTKGKLRHLAYEPASGLVAAVQRKGALVVPSTSRELYLALLDSGTNDLGWWRIYRDGRPPVLVAPGKRVAITEAFAGSTVYYSNGPDFEGIYKRDSTEHVAKLLSKDRIHREMRQARRTGLYFATLEASQDFMWHFEFSICRVKRRFSSNASMGSGLSVSSDEKEIFLTILDSNDTDLYLFREKVP